MLSQPRGIAYVLRSARRRLDDARRELADARDTPDPRRKAARLRNAVVMGRSVTNLLEHLRSRVRSFDAWYKPRSAAMAADPLLKYFYELRSDILKTPDDSLAGHTETGMLSLPEDLGPPPPNAISTFCTFGGAGWVVQLEDGATEQVFVQLPDSAIATWLTFSDAPNSHLGQPIADRSAFHLCGLFLTYLGRFVTEAESATWEPLPE